ncbi:MAG TPA: hypothetical protein VM818_10535 [Vicinamibacterales bacterium]|jgi:hypothetical protein|nr:hypothetical protein [Vicinamibacterales bacterium]
MRTIHWLYLVTILLFVASVGLFVAGASASARIAGEVSDVATTRQIMDGIVMPAAAVVFGSVATIVTKEATEERQPRTAEEWAFVGANAAAIIESGNLLMMGSRVVDKDDWITMTRAMMDAGGVALKATEARDVEGLFSSGEAINEACDACHMKYQQQ